MDDERVEEYRLAYSETVRGITEQEADLAELRSRTGVLIAAGTIVTSFFGPAALDPGITHVSEWFALLTFGAFIVVSLWVLLPRYTFKFRVNGSVIIHKWILGGESVGLVDTLRSLTEQLEKNYDANHITLEIMYARFSRAVQLLALEIAFWVWALAERGGP